MKTTALFALGILCAASALHADDVALSIEPEFGFSSDQATLCRVVGRNDSGHAIDGRSVAFEAQAWRDGVLVQSARGRFGGIIEPGQTVETRIGFNGVFGQFTVTADAKASSRKGSGRGGKGGGKPAKKKGASKAPKTKRRKA